MNQQQFQQAGGATTLPPGYQQQQQQNFSQDLPPGYAGSQNVGSPQSGGNPDDSYLYFIHDLYLAPRLT